MPKQTFFNLSKEKRQIIEQAALDEFSEYGFDASNLNRIVERGKFAKGSFYQYFENKKDLYFHLIDTLVNKKRQYLTPVLDNYRDFSFQHNLKELFRLGLEFSADDPKLQKLGEDFSTMQPSFVKEFNEKYNPESADIFAELLTHAQEKGETQENIDIQISSFSIPSLINNTTTLLMREIENKGKQSAVVQELLTFINRAVLK